MTVMLRRNRCQRGTTVFNVDLRKRRRRWRFNQERSGASLLRFMDELVPIEFSASQRSEQISLLDKAGIVDESRNCTCCRAEYPRARVCLSEAPDSRYTTVHPRPPEL